MRQEATFQGEHGFSDKDMADMLGCLEKDWVAFLQQKGDLPESAEKKLKELVRATKEEAETIKERDMLLAEAKRRGFSKELIAQAIGVSGGAISNLERRRTVTSRAAILLLAWLRQHVAEGEGNVQVIPKANEIAEREAINCPHCGEATPKPPHAVYCMWCGIQLASRCASCRVPSEVEFKFCPHCGNQKGKYHDSKVEKKAGRNPVR